MNFPNSISRRDYLEYAELMKMQVIKIASVFEKEPNNKTNKQNKINPHLTSDNNNLLVHRETVL